MKPLGKLVVDDCMVFDATDLAASTTPAVKSDTLGIFGIAGNSGRSGIDGKVGGSGGLGILKGIGFTETSSISGKETFGRDILGTEKPSIPLVAELMAELIGLVAPDIIPPIPLPTL